MIGFIAQKNITRIILKRIVLKKEEKKKTALNVKDHKSTVGGYGYYMHGV